MSAHAPYNFVPFHAGDGSGAPGAAGERPMERVLLRYRDASELPRHDVIDPALKTGEIHVTMRAETPVFVSDGQKKWVPGINGKSRPIDDPHFFRGANGAYMLPGSTIRGMVRENLQILGFGMVREGEDLKNYQIYFRDVASAGGNPLKRYYHGIMGTKTFKSSCQKPYSIPQNVKAGYLRKKGGSYYIQPVKGSYIRVPRESPALREAGLANGDAMTVNVVYTAANGQVKSIRRGDRPVSGMEQGVLLYTGPGIGKSGSPTSRNARYLFPAADERKERIWISEEDRISYEEDFENRGNMLGKKRDFWRLPRDEKGKPVFYIRHNGHVYFGMSLFLRVGYVHKLSDGLPGRRVERGEGSTPLDYTHAILGFAEKDRAYRSRVSFGDLTALGDPKEDEDIQVILGQPQPSWYKGYVEDGKNYNEDGFRLRGYKFYWLKKPGIPPVSDKRSNMYSVLRPLPAGTEFRGVIRYKNLHSDELGLLLWALRLEEGCYQSLGMGRPYGLGRMKLTIDRLAEYDAAALYRPDSLCRIPTAEDRDGVAGYIRAFDKYICGGLGIGETGGEGPSIRSQPVIQDFFFIRSRILAEAEAGYMGLGGYRNSGSLPTIRQFREEAEAERRTYAGT